MRLLTSGVAGQKPSDTDSEKSFKEGVDKGFQPCKIRLPSPEQQQRFRSISRQCSAEKPHNKCLTDQKVSVRYAALVQRQRRPNRSLTNWNQVIRVGACEWL